MIRAYGGIHLIASDADAGADEAAIDLNPQRRKPSRPGGFQRPAATAIPEPGCGNEVIAVGRIRRQIEITHDDRRPAESSQLPAERKQLAIAGGGACRCYRIGKMHTINGDRRATEVKLEADPRRLAHVGRWRDNAQRSRATHAGDPGVRTVAHKKRKGEFFCERRQLPLPVDSCLIQANDIWRSALDVSDEPCIRATHVEHVEGHDAQGAGCDEIRVRRRMRRCIGKALKAERGQMHEQRDGANHCESAHSAKPNERRRQCRGEHVLPAKMAEELQEPIVSRSKRRDSRQDQRDRDAGNECAHRWTVTPAKQRHGEVTRVSSQAAVRAVARRVLTSRSLLMCDGTQARLSV